MLDKFIESLQTGGLAPLQVFLNLLVALILALMTSFVYRVTHSGYAYSRSYSVTMIIIAQVIALMMMVIGQYLALSLGLIGALSVIRFRTAIKDPKDIAYLFICISIGLVCSTSDYVVAFVGTLTINATLLGLHFLRFGETMVADYTLSFSLHGDDSAMIDEITNKMQKAFTKVTFRSFCDISDAQSQFVYHIKPGLMSEVECILFFQKEVPEARQVSFLAPESSIEI